MTTAKKLGFVQEPSRLCPAARRKAEFIFLGEREQKLALCKEPTAFRTFYQEIEAAGKDFLPVAAPKDLPAHMSVFNDRLAIALEKSIGLTTWTYIGPHLGRKHFLLMAEKFGGCCQTNGPPLPPQRPEFEGGWNNCGRR